MHAGRLNGEREGVVLLLWDHRAALDVEIGMDGNMLKLAG